MFNLILQSTTQNFCKVFSKKRLRFSQNNAIMHGVDMDSPQFPQSYPQREASIFRVCGCSSMAEHQLPKLNTGVRFPSPAPTRRKRYTACGEFFYCHCKVHRAPILPRLASNCGSLALGSRQNRAPRRPQAAPAKDYSLAAACPSGRRGGALHLKTKIRSKRYKRLLRHGRG